MSVIRGLLVSGIRRKSNNNNNSNSSNNSNQQPVLSENEIKMMDQLQNFESEIVNKINTFENESKLNQENKDDAFKMYKNKIEAAFDNIVASLNENNYF